MPIFRDTDQMYEMLGSLWNHIISETDFGSKLKDYDITFKFVLTDPDGRFTLGGLSKLSQPFVAGKWRIAAAHPDYAESFLDIPQFTQEEIEIRLKRGFRVFGKVLDDSGAPCPGVLIFLSGDQSPMPRPALKIGRASCRERV